MNNGGDVLARGGKRAQFSGPKVSQEKWNAIWDEQTELVKDAQKTSGENSPVIEKKGRKSKEK